MDIESLHQLKHQFLVAAFQELKIVVCSIIELITTILESSANTLTEIQEADLRIIHQNAQVLRELLDTWIGLAESESTYPLNQLEIDSLSHNLRTPTSSILLLVRRILQGLDGPVVKNQEVRLNQILKEGERLVQVINQCIDVLHIEVHRAGEAKSYELLYFEDVQMGEIVATISQSTGIETEVERLEGLPIIWGDKCRLSGCVKETVSVLSDNFTQGRIRVDGRIDERSVVIRIRNEQYDLPDNILADFNHMAKASLFSWPQFDEVLTLCISRSVIEMHEGKMYLGQGLGSVAEFALPIRG